MSSSSSLMPFSVDVYSDFRDSDTSPWLQIGEFDDLQGAIEVCKKVIDEFLDRAIPKFSSPNDLIAAFLNYEDVPAINGIDNLHTFNVYKSLWLG